MQAALQNGNGSRWARYVRPEFTVFDMSSSRAELAGGSQLRSLRGVSVLSHPTVTAPVGTPEAPRYHLFFLLVLPFNPNLCDRLPCHELPPINVFLFTRKIQFIERNFCNDVEVVATASRSCLSANQKRIRGLKEKTRETCSARQTECSEKRWRWL